MCGVNGIFNIGQQNLDRPKELISNMNQSISHRGPDDAGFWSNSQAGIYLGHRRLSIIDLTNRAHQPMTGPGGSTIVFNGEIYNHSALRRRHFRGIDFQSNSDTEVVLRLYERFGSGCLSDLNGMFAFALWDHTQGKLFLARDRIGIKPLYYTLQGGMFSFSSEIRALLRLPWVNSELDRTALYHFLTFNNLAPPQTMFANIHKFHPGHEMVVGNQGVERYEPFWELKCGDRIEDEDEDAVAKYLLQSLDESVNLRLVSDVPVGAFLSGGVDSSAVVALMSRHTNRSIKTFSVGFEGAPKYDERAHAARIAQQFGTDHYEKIVSRTELQLFVPKLAEIFDEPLADPTSIPIFFISELARTKGATVVLTGDGADELFAGYRQWVRYHQLSPVFRILTNLPDGLKKGLVLLSRRIIGQTSPMTEILVRAAKRQEFFWGGAGGVKQSTKRHLLSGSYTNDMAGHDLHGFLEQHRETFARLFSNHPTSDLDWMVYMGMANTIPNLYLHRADRMGMANSIELRVPFLDHNLVEYGLALTSKLKVRNGVPKYILKKALEPILPKDLLYRKKMGFCVPLEAWMREIIVRTVSDRLQSFCRKTGIFSIDGVKSLIARCHAGDKTAVFPLWNVYFLMAWFNHWILREEASD